jgi:hypothetical protein
VKAISLTLLVRAYCHLCDEMRSDLLALVDTADVPMTEIDVDGDPAIAKRWGDMVPVLLLQDRELCHYKLDAARVAQALFDARQTVSQ